MVDAYSDVDSRKEKKSRHRRKESRRRYDDSEGSDDEQPYGNDKRRAQKRGTTSMNRGGGGERGVRPSEDIKEGNVRIKTNGFRGGRLDSTASRAKVKRGMRVEDVERDELLDFGTTADLTDIDYDEPDTKVFETQLKDNELELLGKDFNDGVGFFSSKMDIEVIYKDTPHFELKKY